MNSVETSLGSQPSGIRISKNSGAGSFWLAEILANRSLSIICLVLLGLLFILPVGRIPVRFCLVHLMTGLDCPGCGMTRAVSLICKGDPAGGFYLHPFAPLVCIFLIAQSSMLFLSTRIKAALFSKVEKNRSPLTGAAWLSGFLFFFYGAARAMFQAIDQGHVAFPWIVSFLH
ncbi:MAG: hypothetical protein UZ16_OP3001001865 [Candidatus Hinthialibacteria bacterium OLB16]|nr:MAG: hypothetical protein UZ16_OP3001001865 [Candidatus Hinthialibacteria bacterium OLB16]